MALYRGTDLRQNVYGLTPTADYNLILKGKFSIPHCQVHILIKGTCVIARK